MRTEVIRKEIIRMLRRQPYQPIEINIENGDRLVIEHPENISFNSEPKNPKHPNANRFHVVNGDVLYVSTFDAVSSVVEVDAGQVVDSEI